MQIPCLQGSEENKVFEVDLRPGTKIFPIAYGDATFFKVLKKGSLTEGESAVLQTAGIEVYSLFFGEEEIILAVEKTA